MRKHNTGPFKKNLLPQFLVGIILIIFASFQFAFIKPVKINFLDDSRMPDKAYVVFRNDDISYKTDLKSESHLINLFASYNANPIFAIIPKQNDSLFYYENKSLTDSLIYWEQQGYITPAIHGYTHIFRLQGEFKSLPEQIQDSLINSAQLAFRKVFSSLIIFCPPWNLLDENTVEACKLHHINIISGFRGEPVVDSMRYFNANLNLYSGSLPSIQDILQDDKILLNRTILVILYHSSYDFENETDLQTLKNILHELKYKYNCVFSNVDSLNSAYPEYLDFTNSLGLQYKKGLGQINTIKYIGLTGLAFILDKKLSGYYNFVFSGNPQMASAGIKKLSFQMAVLIFTLFFLAGLVLFSLLFFATLALLRKFLPVHKIIWLISPLYLIISLVLQHWYFADSPKWQIIFQFIIYFGIGFSVPAITKTLKAIKSDKSVST